MKVIALFFSLFIFHYSFGQLQIEDLNIDTSITGFRLTVISNSTYTYKPNYSRAENIRLSAFSVSIMPSETDQNVLRVIDYVLSLRTEEGYRHSDIIKKDTTINGYKAYYTSMTESKKGSNHKTLIFYAFYTKDKTAILFSSEDNDKGKYIEKFKKTFYAIKL